MNSIYVLVLVNLLQGLTNPQAIVFNHYTTMDKCFVAWESVARSMTDTAYYPKGTQAVCIELPMELPNE